MRDWTTRSGTGCEYILSLSEEPLGAEVVIRGRIATMNHSKGKELRESVGINTMYRCDE